MNAQEKKGNLVVHDLLIMGLLSLAAVVINLFLESYHSQEINIVLIYLLCTVLTARYTTGYWYSVLSGLIAVVTFDFFFVDPKYSFSIFNHNYGMTFLIMFFIAVYLSFLISQVKAEERKARKREEEATSLYTMINELNTASTLTEIIHKSLKCIYGVVDCECCFFGLDKEKQPELTFIYKGDQIEKIHGLPAGAEVHPDQDPNSMDCFIANSYYEWPVRGQDQLYGYVAIPSDTAVNMSSSDRTMIKAMVNSIALVIDHFLVLQTQQKDKQEAAQERFRSNLLRSISHDLRTPLTGIMGTSEIMMQMTEEGSELHVLAGNIHQESTWLRDLVQNILSLTRLQGGQLHIKKELQIVEEVADAAIDTMKLRYPARPFKFDHPEEVIAAKMDSKLFQQVLINLMDNANKHSPPGKEIELKLWENPEEQTVSVAVIDHGSGLREDQLNKIFTMFYTTHDKDTGSNKGFGLGLPICDSIVKAHGGTLTAGNNPDGQGAVFTITIPEA